MRSHHTVSCFFIAVGAGDHDIAPVHPHPHVSSRDEKCVAVMAVLAPELPVDPDPLAHSDPACKFHVAVAPFGMRGKRPACLFKQYLNTLPTNLFCRGIFGSFFHSGGLLHSRLCDIISVPVKKVAEDHLGFGR